MPGRKLSARDLKTFHKLLEEEKKRLLSELEKIEGERQTIRFEGNIAEERSGEEEAPDAAQEVTELERINAVESHVISILRKVNSALKKISSKTYGVCEGCHKPIEKARLRAIPFAFFCIRCQRQFERGRT